MGFSQTDVNMDDLDEVLIEREQNYNTKVGNKPKGLSPIGPKTLNSSFTNMKNYIQSRQLQNLTQPNLSQGSYNSTNVPTRQSSKAQSKKNSK